MSQEQIQLTQTDTQSRGYSLWLVGPLAILAIAIVNSLIRLIAVSLGVSDAFMGMQAAPVAFMTVMFLTAAVLVFALVRRFTKKYQRNYLIIAAIAFIFSGIGNVQMFIDPTPYPGITTGGAIVLALFHVVSALGIIWSLFTFSKAPQR